MSLTQMAKNIKQDHLGFKIDEVMTGTHRFVGGTGPEGEFPMEFKVAWGPTNVRKWANPNDDDFMTQPMKGTVTVGGLCTDTPCEGTLFLRYFSDHRIRYEFDFAVKDVEYHYAGEKVNIWPWNLPVSHTTCFGVITEAATNRLISRSVTFFRLRTLLGFIGSFRLR